MNARTTTRLALTASMLVPAVLVTAVTQRAAAHGGGRRSDSST